MKLLKESITSNNTEKIVDKVIQAFKEYDMYPEIWPTGKDSFAVFIEWGDWKHDHLTAKHIISKVLEDIDYSVETDVTAEDGSDTYSAIHNVTIYPPKANLDELEEASKPPTAKHKLEPQKGSRVKVGMRFQMGSTGAKEYIITDTVEGEEDRVKREFEYRELDSDGNQGEPNYMAFSDFINNCRENKIIVLGENLAEDLNAPLYHYSDTKYEIGDTINKNHKLSWEVIEAYSDQLNMEPEHLVYMLDHKDEDYANTYKYCYEVEAPETRKAKMDFSPLMCQDYLQRINKKYLPEEIAKEFAKMYDGYEQNDKILAILGLEPSDKEEFIADKNVKVKAICSEKEELAEDTHLINSYYIVDSDGEIKGDNLTREEARELTNKLKETAEDYIYVTRNANYEREGSTGTDFEDIVDVDKADSEWIIHKDLFKLFTPKLQEGRADIYNELEDEYFSALADAEEKGIVAFTVDKDGEQEEEFDSFEEAKKYAEEIREDKIHVSSFSKAYGYYDAGEYVEYDDHILDLNRNIVEKLIQSSSEEAFKKNIETEIEAGKDPKQAVAIAHAVKEKNENLENEPEQKHFTVYIYENGNPKKEYKDLETDYIEEAIRYLEGRREALGDDGYIYDNELEDVIEQQEIDNWLMFANEAETNDYEYDEEDIDDLDEKVLKESVITTYNGTDDNSLDYKNIDFTKSKELGIHCGSEKAASSKGSIINKLSIDTSNCYKMDVDFTDMWSTPPLLQYMNFLTAQEIADAKDRMREVSGDHDKYEKYSTILRDLFLKHGYKCISYPNEIEDPGHTSYIILDDSIIIDESIKEDLEYDYDDAKE